MNPTQVHKETSMSTKHTPKAELFEVLYHVRDEITNAKINRRWAHTTDAKFAYSELTQSLKESEAKILDILRSRHGYEE